MSKLKKLIGGGRAIFASALCLLTCGLLAPLAVAAEICTNCLTFSASEPFGIRMNKGKGSKYYSEAPAVNLQWSTDQFNWQTFAVDQDYAAANVGGTYQLHIRGTANNAFAVFNNKVSANIFTNTAASAATAIACSGNIMTLLDWGKVKNGEDITVKPYAFSYLFSGFTSLTAAPALPATTLTDFCYHYMFFGCKSLPAAPALPATKMARSCYSYMFSGCKSLTEASALSATTLADRCYEYMFYGCTSLPAAPALPATTMTDYCYNSMFSGCKSLTAAPDLPAKTLADSCYNSMFNGCASLPAAPALPATTLPTFCYQMMFRDCTLLKDIPALDVSVVAGNCCKQMFANCLNLVVNTTGPGKEWKIPSTATIASAAAQFTGKNYWATNMFAKIAGEKRTVSTLDAGAEIVSGTTYYVASAPVALSVAALPEHVEKCDVMTNGAPATVPCMVQYNTAVSVTYTAAAGYVFPDGSVTFTTNVVMNADAVTVSFPADQKPQPKKPDYAADDGKDWLYNHAIAGKACPDDAKVSDVDLFYVYPTLVGDEKVVIDGFRGIDDATMRGTATNFMTAVGVYCNSARCFADMTHVYAPFYRQATFDTATDCATNAQGQVAADANDRFLAKLCEGPAYADVTNALTTYFAKWNKGRKFVIAGHSQGSAILRLVMEKYFVENPDKAKLLVCSYQIGFGIGQASIDKITKAMGVTFATKADDTNVIVSYNTMGENASGNSVLLSADTLAINPLTWTRSYNLADKGLNLGALTNDVGKADVIVPHLYGAQVVSAENRGQTVECAELTDKALAPCLFGTGSLYMYDYGAYWEDLHMNCYDRITASTGTAPSGVYKPVETNGIPAVADTTWRIAFDGGEMMVSPANGKCYVRDGVTSVTLVYTLDAAKAAEGYYFADGTTQVSFPMEDEDGVWVSKTSKAEIEAATKVGKPSVQLGVVAQRYPWNGQVDVEYKVMNVPANKYKVAVTVEFGGVKKTFTLSEYAKPGIAKSIVDVKADFGEVKGNVKVSAELVELPPE